MTDRRLIDIGAAMRIGIGGRKNHTYLRDSPAFPQRRELRGDDRLVGHVAVENALAAQEGGHAGDEVARQRGVVIGQVAANSSAINAASAGGNNLLPTSVGARHVRLSARPAS